MKKVAVIGATSGIGRALAVELHRRGFMVGATGRRRERLLELEDELHHRIHIRQMDVTDLRESRKQLLSLIESMGGMDIIVLNAGISNYEGGSEWETEQHIIDVNVTGFCSLTNFSFSHFREQGHGHIVGISSVAALFGYGRSAVYNASKAFISTYMQGYRQKANHTRADITVTDIKPGFVKSEMTAGKKGTFWVADTGRAARQIADAIEKRKSHAYITRRWMLVAWLIKLLPNRFFDRL
ncbi:MAG: SDR family NAD(P)-dependent oxidoreductase [Balneolaceae bacterium]|nr:SDR family NAD(P)-dependent oxidoreductase [Balneolaceae bacterium]